MMKGQGMENRLWVCVLAFGALLAGAAHADEAKIREILQGRFPTMKVESVTKTPFGGLYEVVLDGEVVYTDDRVEYFMGGNLYDIRTLPPRNLTQDAASRTVGRTLASAQDLAIKRVKGSGSRTLYTFEDPNCGYCRQLSQELAKVTDVTVYTFLTPILSQDSMDKSRAIWCSSDRAKAWDDFMLRSTPPTGGTACETPIEKSLQMMRRFGVRGTPAIYLENGRHIGGFIPAEQIERALNSVASK
jgi:thiol:disulfide interchange protein DsbC